MIVKIQFFIQCHLAIAIICSFGKRVSLIKLLSIILQLSGAKIQRKWDWQGENEIFSSKKLTEWKRVVILWLKSRKSKQILHTLTTK